MLGVGWSEVGITLQKYLLEILRSRFWPQNHTDKNDLV